MRLLKSWGPKALLFLTTIALVVSFYYIRKYNLDFHNRDYQYHLNVFSDSVNIISGSFEQLLLSPNGRNALGFSGVDAFPTSAASIHFSPIVYFLGALFDIGGEVLLIVAYTLLTGFGFLAVYTLFEGNKRANITKIILYGALFPYYIYFVTYDFRVYTIFISGIMLLFYFVSKEVRPSLIVSAIIVLFLLREEAYYFSFVAATQLLFYNRTKFSAIVSTISFVYLLALYVYYLNFTKFQMEFGIDTVVFLVLPPLVYLGGVLLKAGNPIVGSCSANCRLRAVHDKIFHGVGQSENARLFHAFLWLNVYLAPIWARALVNVRVSSLFDRYFVLLFSIAIGLGLAVRIYPRAKAVRITITAVSAIFLVVAAGRFGDKFLHFQWERNRLVWDIAEGADPQSLIVTGIKLHQAFWNKNAVVWQRLPAVSVDDDGRFWPDNRNRLAKFVAKADIFVLEREGVEAIQGLGVRNLHCRHVADISVCS